MATSHEIRCKTSFPFLPEAPLQCPAAWHGFQGSCYALFTNAKKWEEAKSHCASHGANLVKIESAAENDFIREKYLSNKVVYWIGLTDMETEDTWQWADGSALSGYENWGPDQPNDHRNNQDQDCGAILKGSFHPSRVYNGQWNDINCSRLTGFICER